MDKDTQFAARIQEQYPEGLTGIFAIGGTRTAYILEHNRNSENPGEIDDFADYADYTLNQYMKLLSDFFVLGGQNLIIPPLSYQAFYERGDAYTHVILDYTRLLVSERATTVYKQYGVDPYFVGIDTLLHLPSTQAIHQLGIELKRFQEKWDYRKDRKKVIWEIAPIPLFSFWRADQVMPEDALWQLESSLGDTTDMREMYQSLYSYYSRAAIGTEIPVPHFYIGTNRNGDLKLRSMTPIALIAGGPFRMFYLPYPSFFMTRCVLKRILEDLAFGEKSRSKGYDYSGRYSEAQIEAEYQRVMKQVADRNAIIGLKQV